VQVSISVTDNNKDTFWSLESDLNGEATVADFKKFIRKATYQIGEEVLKEEQAKGFDKNPRVRTDNKFEKPPEQVKFMGKIEYFSRQSINAALLETYSMLLSKSPSRTGQYKSSHYVYKNGQKVAESLGQLHSWLKNKKFRLMGGDFIRFVNVVPYASRIEVRGTRVITTGKKKGQTVSKISKNAIGNGVYALTARAIRAKYKAASDINFRMVPNGTGGIHVQANRRFRVSYIADRFKKRSSRKRFSGPYVYPTINFKISGRGIV